MTGHIYTTPYLGGAARHDVYNILYARSFLFLKAPWRPVGVKIRVWVCGERVGEGEGEVAIIGRNISEKRAGEQGITVTKGQGRLQ